MDTLCEAFQSLRLKDSAVFNWETEQLTCTKTKFDKKFISKYEEKEISFIKELLPETFYSVWVIRPKREIIDQDIFDDKENDVNRGNYHDERGCPAAAPWMTEKKIEIKADPSKTKSPSLTCSRKMTRLLNELSKNRSKLIDAQLAIAIPVRNENEHVESIGLLYSYMSDDNLEFKIGQTKLYTFENQQRDGPTKLLPVHYPSRNSFSAFVRNLNFYTDAAQNTCKVKSEYRPQISDCFFATISFEWKSELNRLSYLAPPDVSNSNANMFLEINRQSIEWPSEVNEISRQLRLLNDFVMYLEDEEHHISNRIIVKIESVEVEVDKIITKGHRSDLTPDVWAIGEKLEFDQLTAFVTLLLKKISENGASLALNEDNSSLIGLRIQMAKRGRKSNARRISIGEALDMLLQCGEMYVNRLIMEHFQHAHQVAYLIEKHSSDQSEEGDARSNINNLQKKLDLCQLIDAMLRLELDKSTIQRGCDTYLLKSSNKLTLNLDNNLAWLISRKFQPSSWLIRLQDYQFKLQDYLVGDPRSKGKSNLDGSAQYYAIETSYAALN